MRKRLILTIIYSVFVVLTLASAFSFQQDILTYTYENLFKSCYDLSHSTISICYPIESTFYPYPMYILVALVVLIIVIILTLRSLQKRLPAGKIKDYFPKEPDTIALAGVVLSAIAIFVPLVVQNAILDYNVLGMPIMNNDSTKELNVILGNFGLITAKNVMISLNTNNTDVKFSDLILEPTTSEATKFDTNKDGDATIRIGTLPPRSVTVLKTDVSVSRDAAAVTTYIRADEAVGYHNSLLTYIFFGVVLAPVIILVIYKSLPKPRQDQVKGSFKQVKDLHTGQTKSRRKGVRNSDGKIISDSNKDKEIFTAHLLNTPDQSEK